MRKHVFMLLFLLILLVCTSCNKDEKQNILGGYGDITAGAYADNYTAPFFADDVYVYYENKRINKQSGQVIGLCDIVGCMHETPDCMEYKYVNRLFPGIDKMFYVNGKKLYEMDVEGKLDYINVFDTDSNGIALDEDRCIEGVKQVNAQCILVTCAEGSCIYNLDTKEKLYTYTSRCCGNERELYFYDDDLSGIVKVDVETWKTSLIADTSFLYPCMYANNRLYCNTETGAICYIDQAGNISSFLSEAGKRYRLLGIGKERMYYIVTDMDIKTENYTICNMYSTSLGERDDKKIEFQELEPGMTCFWGGDEMYMLKNDMSGAMQKVYYYQIDSEQGRLYVNDGRDDDEDNVFEVESDGSVESFAKYFAMHTGFYAEIIDPFTGNSVEIQQDKVPLEVAGNKTKTIFYCNMIDAGGYLEEGYIYLVVMCDGILQMTSLEGNEPELINRVKYRKGEGVVSNIEIELNNSSENNEIIIGFYVSNTIITDTYEIFTDYHETMGYEAFTYEIVGDSDLNKAVLAQKESAYSFDDIYIPEEDEEDVMEANNMKKDLAVISNDVLVKQQRERWNTLFTKDELYIIFHSDAGNYNLYLLVDDKPVPIYAQNVCVACNVNEKYDTVVFKPDTETVIGDGEKHNVKIMVYDKNEDRIRLHWAQIVQKVE